MEHTFETHAEDLLKSACAQEDRPLIRALNQKGELLKIVGSTSLADSAQATRVARLALEEYPDFDCDMVKFVEAAGDSTESIEQAIHILSMLEAILPRERAVLRLLEIKQSEPRMRSKITLILGRLTRSPKWVTDRLKDVDPRVRANAIEGLWGVGAKGLDRLFLEAAEDPHHRIAANAALGLYFLGDPAAIRILYAMLRHDEEVFRRAAIWAVGQAGDLRYEAALKAIAAKGAPEESAAAEKVLGRFEDRRAKVAFYSSLTLRITQLKREKSGFWSARLHGLLLASNRWLLPTDINALNFIVHQGRNQVTEFSFRTVEPQGLFTAVLVIPSPVSGAAEWTTAAWRGADERVRVAIAPYAMNGSGDATPPDPGAKLEFSSSVQDAFDAVRGKQTEAASLNDAISAGLLALQAQQTSIAAKQCIFVVVPPGNGVQISRSVMALASQSMASVHAVISTSTDDAVAESVRRLSTATGGQSCMTSSASLLYQQILSERAHHFGSFELRWEGPATPNKIKISCIGNFGYSEGVFVSQD